jgi:hypothetical protein
VRQRTQFSRSHRDAAIEFILKSLLAFGGHLRCSDKFASQCRKQKINVPILRQLVLSCSHAPSSIHELATNAAKYGALAAPKGRVSLKWLIADDHLYIEWQEEGAGNLSAANKAGFGSKLIRSASASLPGNVDHEFLPDGLKCAIRLDLAKLLSIEPHLNDDRGSN